MKTTNTRFYIGFIIFLASLFGLYNFIIYSNENTKYTTILSPIALDGQNLWQENSCFTCHQLYGLGGYLGPDLTNVYSTKGKGEKLIKIALNSGIKSMPQFNFTEKEKDALTTFLKEVDQSGYYPNHNAKIELTGWVDIQYKK